MLGRREVDLTGSETDTGEENRDLRGKINKERINRKYFIDHVS